MNPVPGSVNTFDRRTHCSQGHKFVEGSFKWWQGHKVCLQCRKQKHKAHYLAKKLTG